MKTVITFGTFDVFHVGHLRLLQRARALGERLLVVNQCVDQDGILEITLQSNGM